MGTMNHDLLMWIQNWYLDHCDGDWEHQFGIEIGTLDNPGWRIEIDIEGTILEGVAFPEKRVERSENDWLFCEVSGHKFKATCGPRSLSEAIEIFRIWAGESGFQRRKALRLDR